MPFEQRGMSSSSSLSHWLKRGFGGGGELLGDHVVTATP